MTLNIRGTEYELNNYVDMINKIVYLEASILGSDPKAAIAEISYSEDDDEFFLYNFVEEVPLELIEKMIELAKRRLPPIGITEEDYIFRMENIRQFEDPIIDKNRLDSVNKLGCDLKIYFETELVAELQSIPIVEFINSLSNWLAKSADKNFSYSFNSEAGVKEFSIKCQNDAYVLGTNDKKEFSNKALSLENIKNITANVRHNVSSQILRVFSIDVDKLKVFVNC